MTTTLSYTCQVSTHQKRVKPDGDFPARYVSEQRCNKCHQIKGFEDFYRNSKRNLSEECRSCKAGKLEVPRIKGTKHQKRVQPDGDFPMKYVSEQRCRDCNLIKGFEEFYRNNRGNLSSRCRECHCVVTKGRIMSLPAEERSRQYHSSKMRKYGITGEQYEAMLLAQNYACAICGQPETNGRALSVDHDHSCCDGDFSCGKCIRGLLCDRHNTAIGRFNDDPVLLRKAADYLEKAAA